MDIRPECVPCLLNRVLFQSRLAGNGSEFRALSAAMTAYAEEFAEGRNSAEVATEVHRRAYAAMGVEDPYSDLKIRADEVAGDLLAKAAEFVDGSDDRLRAALTVSLAGNIMDFGQSSSLEGPDNFTGMFEDLLAQGIGSDDTDSLKKILGLPGDILFIFDNCGESQLDKILIRELKKTGKKVTGVVRGMPILNDVTMGDALRIGLDAELDGIIGTGVFAIGIPSNVPDEISDALSDSCVVIAKGMANYESLGNRNIGVPVAFVLRAKCVPVANSLNVETGTNVVRLSEVRN
ncbi:MAG: damage-control phosphatase, subfamily [Candidatus Methanomethylophilaceae archaeon]|nr:damage-control phosphatase, subfamily [Candidatus Methanomethylophilaceae archaeon]